MSTRLNEIAAGELWILNPMTDADLRRLGVLAGAGPQARVLDLACGTGELLARWAAWFGTRGTGIDVSETFIRRGRDRAAHLGVADALDLRVGDASGGGPEPGAFDIAACLGAAWIGDGLEGTADLLRAAVRPGGRLVLGDEHWMEPPPLAAVEAIGGPEPDVTLAGNVRRLEAIGLRVLGMIESGREAWYAYESGRWRSMESWLAHNPGEADAAAVAGRLARERRVYHEWGRRYLGWAAFVATEA